MNLATGGFKRMPPADTPPPAPPPPARSPARPLPRAWAMIRPYWFSDDRWAAWGLLLAVVLLTLGMVYLTVLLNQWNNAFYSALQDKNLPAFRAQLFRVTWLICIFILLAVYQTYLNQMLEIRWRRWLTNRYLNAYLADRAYYRMQLIARGTDNPDQRIPGDLGLLAPPPPGPFTAGLPPARTAGSSSSRAGPPIPISGSPRTWGCSPPTRSASSPAACAPW